MTNFFFLSRAAITRVLGVVDARPKPDADLAARLRRREKAAFDEAYDLFHRRIYSYLARLAGRRDVADDLFQETWLAVAKSAGGLADDTDLSAWLFTIATNKWRSFRRWSFFDVRRFDSSGRDVDGATTGLSGESAASARAEVARVEAALSRIAPAHREILLLAAVEGLETAQVAEALGVREDAARKRLSRARAELAELLEADERQRGETYATSDGRRGPRRANPGGDQ